MYDPQDAQRSSSHAVISRWVGEVRRRWLLASVVWLLVLAPIAAYAYLAVPNYTASGVLQVSAQGGGPNPLLELAGAGGSSEVETEVQIILRREFMLAVLKDLRLNLTDPNAPGRVTTDLDVAMRGESPVIPELRQARAALGLLDVDPRTLAVTKLGITALPEERIELRFGDPKDANTYEVGLGETLQVDPITLRFDAMPLDPGEHVELAVASDGPLVEHALNSLRVKSMGTARKATDLVEVRFTHPDRESARAVVEAIMSRYLDQSLSWQKASASNSARFIERRLEEAESQLRKDEEILRQFAEREQAVQLDTQAEVTITTTAALEAEGRQIGLQERVIGSVLSSMKKKSAYSGADLTSNFFEDPVLAASVAALTEAETKHSVLRATLTADHPEVVALGEQIALRQQKVKRLLRSAKKNLSTRRTEIEREVATAMGSLSAYPDKELQLARLRRDVEVDQRLYSFLLEKFQEAEILEASTTIDKRIVDAAALPHSRSSPARAKLIGTGVLAALLCAFGMVYVAHLLQRKLVTVEAVKAAVAYPVYGTVPALGTVSARKAKAKRNGKSRPAAARLAHGAVWSETHGAGAEAFRALAVSVSFAPAAPSRGRIVQITSSQPGEGKSTVISNLAIALAKAGSTVLVVDLDLRKPVQHRAWGLRRTPGYSDGLTQSGGPVRARGLLQRVDEWGIDVLTAGSKLPDTMGALTTDTLEAMLAHWAQEYDYVLIDSPPAFVPDTAIVARHADLLLMVVRPGSAERGNVHQAVETLARLDASKGLVLNYVQRKHSEYHYGYGSGYYYAHGYGYASSDSSDGEGESQPEAANS